MVADVLSTLLACVNEAAELLIAQKLLAALYEPPAEAATTVTVDQVAGLADENSLNVKLYPNPNNGVFEIESSGLTGDKLNCKLFNIQGQLVSEFNLTIIDGKVSQTVEMNKKLTAGSYFLGLYNGSNVIIKEFIKN